MNDEIINLGKMIIKENDVEEYDMLNKWMINYIAEKMTVYEIAKTTEEKTLAGEKCRDAILTFWNSRHNNMAFNPFGDFKELYSAIRRLISNNETTYFDGFFDDYDIEHVELAREIKIIKRCTNKLIKDILFKYVDELMDEKLLEWIGVGKDIEGSEDVGIIDDLLNFKVSKLYDEANDREIAELILVRDLYDGLIEEIRGLKEKS